MKELRIELDQKRNDLEDFKLDMAARANELRYHPHQQKAEQIDRAISAIEEASHKLWVALLCLG